MRTFPLSFETQDATDARRYGTESAVAYLLSERTETWWRLTDCGVGVEILPPYRTCIVRGYSDLRLAFLDNSLAPCALEAELYESLNQATKPFTEYAGDAALLSSLVAVPQTALNGGVALAGDRF